MPPGAFVVMNPVAVHELTHGHGGPVVRDLLIRGERVKLEAIRIAPKKTGNMAQHIVKRLVEIGGEPAVIVGPQHVAYAVWVHEGAGPHVIRPRNAPQLVFFSQKLGKTVFMGPGREVNHPGNKPNRFLIRALRVA